MGEARSAFAPDIWKEWQRPLKICSAVWASPEQLGHQGSSAILYGCSDSGKRPTGVLKWFSLHHAERLGPRSGFPTLGGGREWGDTPDFFHSSSHWCWVHCAIDLCPAKDSIGSIADCANGLCDLRRGLAFRRTKLLLKCSVSANFKVSRRLAAFRRTAAGTMPASISKYCVGVGFRHRVIVRKAEFIATSTSFVLLLLDHAGEQYSAVRYTRARLLVLSVLAEAPHPVLASRFNSAQRDKTFCRTDARCGLRVSDRSSFTQRYVGFGSNSMVLPSTEMCSRPTSSVLRWYEAYTVFSLLS